MDEEKTPQADTVEAEPVTDWKAEARKWEAMAKKSKAAEKELEQLKTDYPEQLAAIQKRADVAEAELAEYKAKAERDKAIRELSNTTGIPASLLDYCEDPAEMAAMAEAYGKSKPRVPAVATCWEHTRIVRDDTPPLTPREQFAEFARHAFNR